MCLICFQSQRVPEVVVGELLQSVGFHPAVRLWHDDLRNTNRLLALIRRHGYQSLMGNITVHQITLHSCDGYFCSE